MTIDRRKLITTGELVLEIGPVRVRVESSIPSVIENIAVFYQDYPQLPANSFADFFVRLLPPRGLRAVIRPQVNFLFDQHIPFKPLPLAQAFPFFEWGLNWCVAQNCHQYLIIHAAVLERGGASIVLPGFPAAGKSTLTAALTLRGWRLLSDELTLFDLKAKQLVPIPRPVSLKNASLDIIQEFDNEAFIGERVRDTSKGTVGHMRVPPDSVMKAKESVAPAFILFPHFALKAPRRIEAVDPGLSFMKLAELSFNYNVLGAAGFHAMHELVSACRLYDFHYDGDLDYAIGAINELTQRA